MWKPVLLCEAIVFVAGAQAAPDSELTLAAARVSCSPSFGRPFHGDHCEGAGARRAGIALCNLQHSFWDNASTLEWQRGTCETRYNASATDHAAIRLRPCRLTTCACPSRRRPHRGLGRCSVQTPALGQCLLGVPADASRAREGPRNPHDARGAIPATVSHGTVPKLESCLWVV